MIIIIRHGVRLCCHATKYLLNLVKQKPVLSKKCTLNSFDFFPFPHLESSYNIHYKLYMYVSAVVIKIITSLSNIIINFFIWWNDLYLYVCLIAPLQTMFYELTTQIICCINCCQRILLQDKYRQYSHR